MTAEPVQVLVTIHPPEGAYADWVGLVHEAATETNPPKNRHPRCLARARAVTDD